MNETAIDSDSAPVANWMQQLAELPEDSVTLLDPQRLWWKAQALRRIDAANRAVAAFDRIETMQIVGSVAAALLLFVSLMLIPGLWNAPSLFLTAVGGGVLVSCVVLLHLWSSRGPRNISANGGPEFNR
jgi:hypothetical protein